MKKLIKIGSRVRMVDGSYCLSILNGSFELKHNYEGLRKDVLTVVAINVSCPTDNSFNTTTSLSYHNNCILKSDEGDIIFCSQINIENIEDLFS